MFVPARRSFGLELLYAREGRERACKLRDRRFVSPWITHLNNRSRSSGRERRANSAATTAPLRAIQLVTDMLRTDMALLLSRKRMSKALSSVPLCAEGVHTDFFDRGLEDINWT
jgi:hypothetical protein